VVVLVVTVVMMMVMMIIGDQEEEEGGVQSPGVIGEVVVGRVQIPLLLHLVLLVLDHQTQYHLHNQRHYRRHHRQLLLKEKVQPWQVLLPPLGKQQ
jgi:hypothetical protein